MKQLITAGALALALAGGPFAATTSEAAQRARRGGGGDGGGKGSGGTAAGAPTAGAGERARPRSEPSRRPPEDATGRTPDRNVRGAGEPRERQRPQTRAVPRSEAPPPSRPYPGGPGYGGYYPYYPYGAFGLGYFFYDPWWNTPYSGYGYPGSGGSYWWGGQGYQAQGHQGETGGLRLKVKPRDAQVWVDGYYAGVVNDFDGVFQRLNLPPGPHRIEIRRDAHEPLVFDIRIIEGETVTYRGELRR